MKMVAVSVTRNRSLSDVQRNTALTLAFAEDKEQDYYREVLQLAEGLSEAQLDDHLVQRAEQLGITITKPPSANDNQQDNTFSESADTIQSHHARTASSASNGTTSTGITSRSSNEVGNGLRKTPSTRRSLSFTEYEKYLAQQEAQNTAGLAHLPPPISFEPAPSLFSVSTRRSYVSIKNGIKSRFRLRRDKGSQEDSK